MVGESLDQTDPHSAFCGAVGHALHRLTISHFCSNRNDDKKPAIADLARLVSTPPLSPEEQIFFCDTTLDLINMFRGLGKLDYLADMVTPLINLHNIFGQSGQPHYDPLYAFRVSVLAALIDERNRDTDYFPKMLALAPDAAQYDLDEVRHLVDFIRVSTGNDSIRKEAQACYEELHARHDTRGTAYDEARAETTGSQTLSDSPVRTFDRRTVQVSSTP